MQSALLVLIAIVLTVVATDPARPKTILKTGTALYIDKNPDPPGSPKMYTYYIDVDNQLLRFEYSQNGTVGIGITDYKILRTYLIFANATSLSCYRTPATENIFTRDMFASATYGGSKSVNGHIVNEWNDASLNKDERETVYLDAFTGDIIRIHNAIMDLELEIEFMSKDVPDPKLFQLPKEISAKCGPVTVFPLHKVFKLFH
jgi:hypothetical protein